MPGANQGLRRRRLRHPPRPDPVVRPGHALSNRAYGGVLEEFLEPRVMVLECGGGWIAHWMDRLDEFLESYALGHPRRSPWKPSENFRRQCWITFDPGERTPAHSDRWSERTGSWASDFPTATPRIPASSTSCGRPTRTSTRTPGGLLGANAWRCTGSRRRPAERRVRSSRLSWSPGGRPRQPGDRRSRGRCLGIPEAHARAIRRVLDPPVLDPQLVEAGGPLLELGPGRRSRRTRGRGPTRYSLKSSPGAAVLCWCSPKRVPPSR